MLSMAALKGCTVLAVALLAVAGKHHKDPKCQDYEKFPDKFLFGSATSSYQVEGAWNTNACGNGFFEGQRIFVDGCLISTGKGENIWDHFTHTHPDMITDRSNGDIAADSYTHFKEDVRLLKKLNMNTYRFSISWSRVLPNGYSDVVNQDGIDYYNALINELLNNGITPVVTMYHWDLPQPLQEEFGGWLDERIVPIFEDYARLLYSSFGDRVKWWVTFNEPKIFAMLGYTNGEIAPGLNGKGVNNYIVGHTILKSHARAYHIYDDEFRHTQNGKVSITLYSAWAEPNTDSVEDAGASDRAMQFDLGWFAHPIYSNKGDYPLVMRQRIAAKSAAAGLPQSRLPKFNKFWIKYIRGTWDFFGLNHYTTQMVTSGDDEGDDPSWYRDIGVHLWDDPSWPNTTFHKFKVVPWGFRKVLNWVKTEYKNPPIFVTENGFADAGELDDQGRIHFFVIGLEPLMIHANIVNSEPLTLLMWDRTTTDERGTKNDYFSFQSYLREMLKAYHFDGVNVIGYTAWSLLDNFQWEKGYTVKFGIFQVDFKDPARIRKAKSSAAVLSEIGLTRRIPPEKTKALDQQ